MAEPRYALSAADVQLLREMAAEYRRRRPYPASSFPKEADPTAPECYVARTPAGGIPGLEEHTGTSPDEPGSAVCQIYNLRGNPGATTGTGDDTYALYRVSGLTRRVFNLTHRDLPGSAWIVVQRTKFGAWVTDSPAEDAVTSDDTGTGTGTDVDDPDDFLGGGACSDLLRAGPNDCIVASGPDGQEVYLESSGAGSWTSTEEMEYPGGSGTLTLAWNNSTGLFDLTLDGAKLANCGNGCYTGGWATGHVPAESGTTEGDSCDQEVFTVCVSCSCCPIDGWDDEGWYCVRTGTGTGTGTGPDDCEPLFLTEDDKCDPDVVICSGPYATEAEAAAVCQETEISPGTTCATATTLVVGSRYLITGTGSTFTHWFRFQAEGDKSYGVVMTPQIEETVSGSDDLSVFDPTDNGDPCGTLGSALSQDCGFAASAGGDNPRCACLNPNDDLSDFFTDGDWIYVSYALTADAGVSYSIQIHGAVTATPQQVCTACPGPGAADCDCDP